MGIAPIILILLPIFDFKDSILFLEGYKPDEEEIVFKLEHLKQLGVFDKIKGLVIGYIYS